MASSSTPQDYADGNVIEISMGASEFNAILQSASSRRQLVLLDFSASWCGPCKMLVPVLAGLAREYRGRLVVAKMDCEKTAANQSLAADNAISAYPTLHLYRERQKVATLRGANPAAIRQAITEQLALLGGGAGTHEGPGALAKALATALAKVKASCSYEDFLAAAKALTTYADNVIKHPDDPKYRKVRLANAAYQSKVGSKPGGRECMEVLGFQERTEAMEPVLVMDHVHPQLPSVLNLLQQAMGVSGARVAVSSAPPSSAPAAAPAAPPAATPPPAPAPSNVPISSPTTSERVDAVALSQALANTSVPQQGSHAGDATSQGLQIPVVEIGPPEQRRRLALTPQVLARMLEQAMRASGFVTSDR